MKRILNIFLAILICASFANALDQPRMTAARNDLNKAEKSLRKATADKGGHRSRAINLVNQAIAEVNRGIAFDRNNPKDRRQRRNSDFDESNSIASSFDQSNMKAAKEHLEDALNNLQRADNDKGGHRQRAINLVREAINEVEKGIAYDRRN